MFAFRAVGQAWIAVRGEVFSAAIRTAAVHPAHVDIKALVFRPIALGTKMPFTRKEGGIPGLLQ